MIVSYKVNMAGPYHEKEGIPCQDSLAIKEGKDGYYIAAVADGLGSELYSDIGSYVAVHRGVDYCAENIEKGMSFGEIKKIMNNAFVYAYKAVLERADADKNSPDEYDTTLCLVVYDGQTAYYAQSGDSGLVVLLQNGEYCRVTSQQRDDEGRVFPLCWGPEKWEFGYVDQPVSGLMLMTDGVFEQICPPVMKNHKVDINIPLAEKFLNRFDCEEVIDSVEEAAYKYLKNYPESHLDDDKTVIVLMNTDLLPERRNDTYYQSPDWETIRMEIESVIYSKDDTVPSQSDNEDAVEDAINVKEIHVEKLEEKIEECIEESNKKKRLKKTSRITNSVVPCIIIFMFGCFAWIASGVVKKHVKLSMLGVFIACFFSNASILLPSSSIAIVIEYSILINPIGVIISGALGASFGELTGYCAGKSGRKLLPVKVQKYLKQKMKKYKYLMVFILSVIPLPIFDFIGIISGMIRLNPVRFFVTCFWGKLIKFSIYVWMVQIITSFV